MATPLRALLLQSRQSSDTTQLDACKRQQVYVTPGNTIRPRTLMCLIKHCAQLAAVCLNLHCHCHPKPACIPVRMATLAPHALRDAGPRRTCNWLWPSAPARRCYTAPGADAAEHGVPAAARLFAKCATIAHPPSLWRAPPGKGVGWAPCRCKWKSFSGARPTAALLRLQLLNSAGQLEHTTSGACTQLHMPASIWCYKFTCTLLLTAACQSILPAHSWDAHVWSWPPPLLECFCLPCAQTLRPQTSMLVPLPSPCQMSSLQSFPASPTRLPRCGHLCPPMGAVFFSACLQRCVAISAAVAATPAHAWPEHADWVAGQGGWQLC